MSRLDRIVIGIVTLGFAMLAVWFIFTQEFKSWDFRNNLWGPAHLLTQSKNPYLIEQLFANSNAIWLPVAVGAFFWLGYLSLPIATNLWLVMNLTLYTGTIMALVWSHRLPRLWYALIFLMVLLFPPFVSQLILGQYSILATVLLLISAHLLMKPSPILMGILMVVAFGKPQLAVLPACGLVLGLYRFHGFKAVIELITAMIITTAVLLIPVQLGNSHWLQGFETALERNPTWAQPSLWLLMQQLFPNFWLIIWLPIVVIISASALYLWWTQKPDTAMRWTLALNVLVAPYIWSWDFVLLMPLFIHTFASLKKDISKAWLTAGYLACWGGIIYIRVNTDNRDVQYWWVPPALLLLIGTAILLNQWAAAKPRI